MKYSSIFRRFFAFTIDILVILASFLLLGFILGINAIFEPITGLPMLGIWFFSGIFVFGWLYFALLESSSWQATVGKRVLRLKVVDLSGNPISFWRATARYYSKMLSRFIFMIGFLMIAFTKKRQALHDKVARTLIIRS